MLGLSKKILAKHELEASLAFFEVDETPRWVGQTGSLLYKPYQLDMLGLKVDQASVVKRVCFVSEWSLAGKHLTMPADHLGQAALVMVEQADNESAISGVAIPFKERFFSLAREAIVVEEYSNCLTDSNTDSNRIKSLVTEAIFNLINTNPQQLTSTGESYGR